MTASSSPIVDLINDSAKRTRGYPITPLHTKKIIDLNGGSPDSALFPAADFVALMDRVLREDRIGAIGYGGGGSNDMMYGYGGLRAELVEWAAREDGRQLDLDSVLLTSGAAHGLDLIFRTFVGEGSAAIVEEPTWGFVLQANTLGGAQSAAVPIDAEGIIMEKLEAQLAEFRAQGTPVKLVYTIANFNTPTGVSMSLARRRRLLELAQQWNFVILEDDTYGEIRYEGEPIPSMFGMDDSGLVVKVKSFSKFLAPSLRTGWVLGHPEAIAAMSRMRRDLGNSQLTSRMLAQWVHDGNVGPHLKEVLPIYAAKRDLMEAGLAAHCAPHVTWNHPDGGFFTWLQFSDAVNTDKLNAAMAERGIQGRSGQNFYLDQTVRPSLRAAFSRAPVQDIEKAMVLMGEAIEASLE